ncbi:crossover junction endodeoxyribonuclease RuvC [Candidatus Nomurabacteria bacterium]|nr:crossover junction endodeoxyribonuclease RuvC [Candidatus Nomurabacteria bacterium]
MKIIAVDPGYERVGIAILEKNSGDKKEKVVFSKCFKTNSKLEPSERLKLIGKEVEEVIKKYDPEFLAIETLFFNTNQKTAMMVSQARGVILYQSCISGLKVCELTPLQVKTAVTGYGRSDKKAVIDMIPKLVSIEKEVRLDDEYDAIAIGITFFAYNKIT